MRVIEPSGFNAWLTITRRKQDFELADDALLKSIAPYLRSVLRSFVALERERTNAFLAGDAIQRLSFGWITLDASGRILEADAQASLILAKSGALRRDAHGFLAGTGQPQLDIGQIRACRRCLRSLRQLAVLGFARPCGFGSICSAQCASNCLIANRRRDVAVCGLPQVTSLWYLHSAVHRNRIF